MSDDTIHRTCGAKTEEAAKKRQEYLQKKAAANMLRFVGAATTVTFGIFWLLALFGIIAGVSASLSSLPILLGAGLLALPSLGAAVLVTGEFWHASAEAAKSIPYVPPVHEQIASLPADEVLLRGSNQPAAQPEELLRAARAAAAEPAEELLRAETTMAE